VLIGGPALLLAASHSCAYFSGKNDGKEMVYAEWDASIMRQAKESVKQAHAAHDMTSKVARETAGTERAIAKQIKDIREKVVEHARTQPSIIVSGQSAALIDRLSGVSSTETGNNLSGPDSGPGESKVQQGEVRAPTSEFIQLESEGGTPIELTAEEAAQFVVDLYEKFQLLRNDYQGLSSWNDGREAIELAREAAP
jgi:hypothetical protein